MTDAESNEAGKAYDDSPDIGWYEALRATNKPERIRLLLIGESPPDPRSAERRFFYSPLLKIDNLYRGVAEALYGKDAGFNIKDKPGNLERMKSDGVWLIDAVRHPVNAQTTAQRRQAIRASRHELIAECIEISPNVGVLICHTMVFKEAAPGLADAGVNTLHDAPLPFPLGNHRRAFVDGTRVALQAAGWW